MNYNGHHLILRQFYCSSEWSEARKKFLRLIKEEKRPLVCNLCSVELYFVSSNQKHKTNKKPLNIDHILPVKYFWDKRLDLDNLQLLCADCNKAKGNLTNESDIQNSVEAYKIEETILKTKPVESRHEIHEKQLRDIFHVGYKHGNVNKLFKPVKNFAQREVEVSTIEDSNGKSCRVFKLPLKNVHNNKKSNP